LKLKLNANFVIEPSLELTLWAQASM